MYNTKESIAIDVNCGNKDCRVPALERSYSDTQKLKVIRRANLDLFWSRAAATVRNVVGGIKEVIRRSEYQGWLIPPLEPMTPWPLADGEGMGVAILMLEKSLEPGRNSKTYQQFDSVRKL